MLNNKLAIFVLIFCCCCRNGDGFIKHPSGVQYKIISYGQSDKVFPGETLKLQLRQMYEDSLLSDTRDSIPFYQVYDSTQLSRDSYDIFREVRTGDSLVFKVLSDSAFKHKWPPFAKKGKYLFTYVKVEKIFGVKEDFRDDLKKEVEKRQRSFNP